MWYALLPFWQLVLWGGLICRACALSLSHVEKHGKIKRQTGESRDNYAENKKRIKIKKESGPKIKYRIT